MFQLSIMLQEVYWISQNY